MEYNTQRGHLTLREYGRNVQHLVEHIQNTPDKEKRNKYASLLVELMKMINPEFNKDAAEYTQKVWDDLFIIADFKLDVESPFPIPEPSILERKPDRMRYRTNDVKYRHYGRNLEVLIQNAIAMEDPKEKEGAIIAIGRLMKSFYLTWNKDFIEDEQVIKNIREMSKGQLEIDIAKVKEYGLFDMERPRNVDSNNRGQYVGPNQAQHQNTNRNRNPNQNKGNGKRPFNNKNRRRNNN